MPSTKIPERAILSLNFLNIAFVSRLMECRDFNIKSSETLNRIQNNC